MLSSVLEILKNRGGPAGISEDGNSVVAVVSCAKVPSCAGNHAAIGDTLRFLRPASCHKRIKGIGSRLGLKRARAWPKFIRLSDGRSGADTVSRHSNMSRVAQILSQKWAEHFYIQD